MLAVPYLEKALYEMPEDQLTVESLRELADRTEMEVQVSQRVGLHVGAVL